MSWPLIDMEEMIEHGLVKLGRGNVISKLDIAAHPGPYPIYSSAQMNNGKFGEYGKYMFDKELITWSVDGGGQLFYRPKHKFSVTNVAGTLEVLNGTRLDCRYLHYVLSDKHTRLKFDWIRKAHPSVIRRLYKEIPVPPVVDQRRIAHLLVKVEGLITQRKQHLQQLDELLKSVFLEMFGDPVRNEKGWDEYPLFKQCPKITDGTHDTPERLTKGVPFITGKHIRPYSIDYSGCDFVSAEDHSIIYSRCDPKYGDVLYTNIGVNLGTAAMNTVHFEFSMKNVALLRPSLQLSSRFLEHYLNFEKVKAKIISDLSSGGAQKFLGLGQIKKIAIIIPPMSLQNSFAGIVEKVEGIKSRYQQSLTDLEALYGALSQKAFKGELDLSRVPLPDMSH